MSQKLQENKSYGKLAVLCGILTVVFFCCYLFFSNHYAVEFLETTLLKKDMLEESTLSQMFNHLFVLFTVLFSGFLWQYFKRPGDEIFREASSFYFLAYIILLLRTFIIVFQPESLPYILIAGIQILITSLGMLFFLITFLNDRKYLLMAILTAFDMLGYLASVIYSVFMAEFILPNLGSILVAVTNISFLSAFLYRRMRQNDLKNSYTARQTLPE